MQASDFSYVLPTGSIAQKAIEPRDSARLLVTSTMAGHDFADLPQLLESGDLLVVNHTKVRAARLSAVRVATGGVVEVLLVKRVDALRWEALFRPARRMRKGLMLEAGCLSIELLTEPVRGVGTVAVDAPGDVENAIALVGELPLPPYFHGSLERDDRYQTMFAKWVGSAAAPTAALHFTPRVVSDLAERGVRIEPVELAIGLDTFRSMADGSVAAHKIHREAFHVPSETARAIASTVQAGGRVIAVGTTVVRTLETAAESRGVVRVGAGESDLFITPGFRPLIVDAMITNFHAPQTTLIVMIAALLGERWRTVYDHALADHYRFLSFGDAMFIDQFAC